MARIFISYGHLEPDQAVAHELASALDSSGHEVFIDTQIPLGSTWGDLIEERLADVDCLIALVSASSSTNPMVVTEIETAHHLNRINGRPLIIPVRVGDDFHLRYPLSAYVSRFQHGVWRGKGDTAALTERLKQALTKPQRRHGIPRQRAALIRASEMIGLTGYLISRSMKSRGWSWVLPWIRGPWLGGSTL